MASKAEIPTLVGRALKTFHTDPNNRPGDPLLIDEIGSIIESETGETLYDGAADDIKNEMIRRQSARQGVKRLSASAHTWALEPWFVPD